MINQFSVPTNVPVVPAPKTYRVGDVFRSTYSKVFFILSIISDKTEVAFISIETIPQYWRIPIKVKDVHNIQENEIIAEFNNGDGPSLTHIGHIEQCAQRLNDLFINTFVKSPTK